MSIVDILIGFVGGGAIGGGALYALQQGKIREALQKQEKIQAALGETEAELKDTQGELKRLELSQEGIGNIEATYREEVAKLQKELEDSQGRLQEAAGANPVQATEVAYKTQIQELEQEYETKIEELRQSYQSQIREIIDGKQAEMEALRQSQQAQILELEKGYQWQIQQLEQSYQSQLLELQNDTQTIQPGEEINPFDGFITEETLGLEPEFAPETLLEATVSEPEFVSEINTFDGFITEENLDLAAEFTPEMEMFDEEEETRMIGSLEELSGNYDQSYSQETVGSNTGFSDLLATDSEKFAAAPNSLDDLFADITDSNSPELFDPFAAETPEVESNRQNVASVLSNQEALDFFSMWDDEGVSDLESLPSEEEFPLDDLFSDDLFSDGDNS
jgi:phage host-nuclease inhibitor protein Gam